MTDDDIRSRIIEAAEIERRLPGNRLRPAGAEGFWPEIPHTFEDQVGWTVQRHREEAEAWARQAERRCSSAEVTRMEEVHGWIRDHVTDENQRRALWAWGAAQIGGQPFAKWCRLEGIQRQTGYRRVDRAIGTILREVAKNGGALEHHSGNGVLHMSSVSAMNDGRVEELQPTHWMAPDAKPSDSPEGRDLTWSDEQNARRREREAARRKKLGLVEA